MLKKSRKNVVIDGVCGGIADYFGWDPTIVRLAYVLLTMLTTTFPGFLLYLLLMIIMPSDH